MALLIGLDVGGTKCAAVCARQSGNGKPEILRSASFATAQYPHPDRMLPVLLDAVKQMCASLDDVPCGVGISCGGPLDSQKGVILSPPNLPSWDEVPITDFFRRSLGVPVFLQNDANACALAEWQYGAGVGCRNMVFLTFGTGLGAGLILDGRLYSGTNDMAGEAGHIRLAKRGPVGYGKSGSFEGFCSGGGVARLAQQMRPSEEAPTAKALAEAARQGDAFALSVYATCGAYLGRGLAVLVDLLNPERIVIGSIYARSGELLREAMMKTLRQEALPRALAVCSVVPAALGDALGSYAALGVLTAGLEERHD